ncbi:MAG: tetratricopeptide repeat protein [Planctomycetota bacterium]
MINGKDAIRCALLTCALFQCIWQAYADNDTSQDPPHEEEVVSDLDTDIAKATAEIERDPSSGYFKRAVYLDQKMEFVRALKDYAEAIRTGQAPRSYILRGELWREMGESELADQDFDEGLRRIDEFVRKDARLEKLFHQERAWALYAKGDAVKAIAELDKALESELKPSLLLMRGIAWRRLGNLQKAEADFDKVIELVPKHSSALCERGRLYAARGDFQRAFEDFSEGLRADPNQPLIYTSRANAYLMLRQYDKAISDCSEAIKIVPLYAPAYRHRGCARLALGNVDLALNDFNQAVQFTPSYVKPGLCGRELFPLRGARDRIHYYDFLPQLDRAGIWRMKGEWEKAIVDLKETLRMDPASTQAQNDLAWIQATCPDAKYRDGKSAIELARKACEATKWKKDDFIVTLAAAHAENSEYDEAIKRLTQANEIDPKRDAATRENLLNLFKQSMPFRESVKDK